MKRNLAFLIVMTCLMVAPTLSAQNVVNTSVCDILSNPQSFDGKLVRIRGVVIAGFEEFVVKGAACNRAVNAIWLAYPEGAKGKAGPAAFLRLQLGKNSAAFAPSVSRVPVKLDRTKDFKEFDKVLSTPARTEGICLGCVKYSVTATLVGRLDGTKAPGLIRDSGGKVIGIGGFGNLNRYRARLVLQSVSEVVPQKIDYAKGGASPSNDGASSTQSFPQEAPTAGQLKRAVDAFGAPGEDNGVIVGFGGANEVPKDESPKSNANSPDGLVFDVIFDGGRLKGTALTIALAHVGAHIADIRATTAGIETLPLYTAEFRAWQTSVLSAVSVKAKALSLPGGTAIYRRSWSRPDLWKNADGGISRFLANWASLTNPAKR